MALGLADAGVRAGQADASALPTRIVAAVDFGAASVKAVHAASAIAGDGSTLTLAYVAGVPFPSNDGELEIHRLGVKAAFERTVAEVARPGLRVDHLSFAYEPKRPVSATLLAYAEETGADLIAAGSAPHTRVDRWMIGSVSTELVRDGRHTVLIVPAA